MKISGITHDIQGHATTPTIGSFQKAYSAITKPTTPRVVLPPAASPVEPRRAPSPETPAVAPGSSTPGLTIGTEQWFGQRGLLAAGVPGVQLTWMDAKVGDWVVTPRIGKPVEIQALWLNALWIGSRFNNKWLEPLVRGRESFRARFRNEPSGCLYDVVDADHQAGKVDASFRPNQIFAVGGLPISLLDGERARRVVDEVERRLWTPLGLRSLAPDETGYTPHYDGGVRERDGAYHQGTVWAWLLGPFALAHLRVYGDREAARGFLAPMAHHLGDYGIGSIAEIFDGDPPFAPAGCSAQAWSVGEVLRAWVQTGSEI